MTNINPVVFQEGTDDGIGCVPSGVNLLPIVGTELFPFQLNTKADSLGNTQSLPITTVYDENNNATVIPTFALVRRVIYISKYEGNFPTDHTHSTLGQTNGYGFSIGNESSGVQFIEFQIEGVEGFTPTTFIVELLDEKGGNSLKTIAKDVLISSRTPTTVVFDLGQNFNLTTQKFVRISSKDGFFKLYGSDKSDYDSTVGVETEERLVRTVVQGDDVYTWTDAPTDQSHGSVKLYSNFDGRRYNSLRYDGTTALGFTNGAYRLKIEWGNDTWYSEWFYVKEYLGGISKITYWHNEPIVYHDQRKVRHIDFSDGFKYWWYVNHEVGGEEVETVFREQRNDGRNYIQRVDSYLSHKHFNLLRKKELRAFRLIAAHHHIEVRTQDDELIYVDKMEIENEWNDKWYTEVEIEYHSDTVVSTTNLTVSSVLKGEYSDDYSPDYNI